MRKTLFIILALAVCLLPLDAKRKKKTNTPPLPKTQVERIGRENAERYRYCYMEAVRQQGLERYAEAFELYRHCLDIDPDAPEANFGIARFYSAFRMDSMARAHLKKAVELEPQNGEFLEALGQSYLRNNEVSKATELYERISKQYPDRTELLEILLNLYEHQKDYDNMLRVVERIETAEGANEQLTLIKMQVYSQKGDDEGAHRSLNELIVSHPNDPNYKVMMGNWLLQHSRKEEALSMFLGVLKEEPDHAQAQMSLMDYYRADGKSELADSLLYTLLENAKTEPQTRITMMRQVIKDNETSGGDSTRILNIFRHVLRLPQKTNDMAYMQAAYMEHIGMPKDSLKAAIGHVLEITPEDVGARLKYISYLWEDSIDDNVIRECKKGIDYSPKETSFYYYLGLANYINDKPEAAIEAFRGGAATISDDTSADLASRVYMLLGDALHQIDRKDEAYAAYDSCLVYNPEQISCLNNYAYFLSVDGKELKKAEQMSYRTIKAEPNNGTYLDTYAWILYKQERYEEARMYMDQVLKNDFDTLVVSADVLEHAGDIYLKLGEKAKARDFYKRALDRNGENAAEVRKKLSTL